MVVVNLSRSRAERCFQREESFWEDKVDRMVKLVQCHAERLNDADGSTHPTESLAIAIIGERGSGKSSLLRTFTERIKEAPRDESGPIRILSIMDPTILGEKDNFLFAVISDIIESIERDPHNDSNRVEQELLGLRFNRVMEHLWTVNGKDEAEEDRLLLAANRLDRHRGGPLLRKAMGEFLDRFSLGLHEERSAGRSIVLLPVDDADLSFLHMLGMIDQIRRFLLTSAAVVPVFAFSRALAERLLQRRIQEQLGRQLAPEDGDVALAKDLTYHYLAKLFPPRSRFYLSMPRDALINAELSPGADGSSRRRSPEALRQGGEATVQALLTSTSMLLFGDEITLHQLLPDNLRGALQLLDGLASAGSGTTQWRRAADAVLDAQRQRFAEDIVSLIDLVATSEVLDLGSLVAGLVALPADDRAALISDWRRGRTTALSGAISLAVLRSALAPRQASSGDPLEGVDLLIRVLDSMVNGLYLPVVCHTGGSAQGDGAGGVEPRAGSRYEGGGVLPLDSLSAPGLVMLHHAGRPRVTPAGASGSITLYPEDHARSYSGSEFWRGYGCARWLGAIREMIDSGTLDEEAEETLRLLPGVEDLRAVLGEGGRMLLDIWIEGGLYPEPWSAVSLWRGVGLLGRLGVLSEARAVSARDVEAVLRGWLRAGSRRRDIRSLAASEGSEISRHDDGDTPFGGPSPLASALVEWLDGPAAVPRWRNGPLRVDLLHGHRLIGGLFRELERRLAEEGVPGWGAGSVLRWFLEELIEYLCPEQDSPARLALLECPLLAPFGLTENAGEVAQAVFGSPALVLGSRPIALPGLRWMDVLDALYPRDCDAYFTLMVERFRGARDIPVDELV